MKAFWWFENGSVAGMARPGFNKVHWFDLPFDEAVVLGWIGLHSSGSAPMSSFRHHLETYVPQIFKYHKLDEQKGREALQIFNTSEGFTSVVNRLVERTHFLKDFSIANDQVHFEMCDKNLQREIVFLKEQEIDTIITLTERHHGKDILQDHFNLHHLGIADLCPPTIDQVDELADILKKSQAEHKRVAVHCLAGIGRTSTMLMAAHLVMGRELNDLKNHIAKQNPKYAMTGSQGDFITHIACSKGSRTSSN